jgi:protein-tyrosine kinase
MSRINEALRRKSAMREDAGAHGPTEPEAGPAFPIEGYPGESEAPPLVRPHHHGGTVAHEPQPASRPMPTPPPEALHVTSEGRLVMGMAGHRAAIESYQRIAATLQDIQVQSGVRSLMVASVLPGDGRTLTVVNLALALSSVGQRVLLIDADLRNPSLHHVLGVRRDGGLDDALRGDPGKARVIEVTALLGFLPGRRDGPLPDVATMVPRLRHLVMTRGAGYDWVLLDAPALEQMTETHLLAQAADAVVLVVRADVTPVSAVEGAVATLGRERVLGVVLNAASDEALPLLHHFRPPAPDSR